MHHNHDFSIDDAALSALDLRPYALTGRLLDNPRLSREAQWSRPASLVPPASLAVEPASHTIADRVTAWRAREQQQSLVLEVTPADQPDRLGRAIIAFVVLATTYVAIGVMQALL